MGSAQQGWEKLHDRVDIRSFLFTPFKVWFSSKQPTDRTREREMKENNSGFPKEENGEIKIAMLQVTSSFNKY